MKKTTKAEMKAALECVVVTLEQNATCPADIAYALAVARDALGLPAAKRTEGK